MTEFSLDSGLEGDTLLVGELQLSHVLLMNDARYPWAILVPRRPAIREMIDLDLRDRAMLYREIDAVSEAMQRLFKPLKLNVAALGNVVPQLHVHVIARFEGDAAWPKPVWGIGERVPYASDAAAARIGEISTALGRL
jgi:diadenosine tetraphosphate (Ap4A) HIT family hydrolase